MAARILLVDDDPGLRLALSDRFESEGFKTETASDGDQALARAAAEPFDVVILDVMLPGKGGFDVCRELRRRGVETPVLLLSARGQVADRVTGLRLGADDYVVKPFEMAELVARIEARVRARTPGGAAPTSPVRFGRVVCDLETDEVRVNDRVVELSGKELRLLRYLVEHQGATVSRDELLREVWGYTAMPLTRTVDVHVAWLRRKLEPNPRHPRFILTVHGLGYKFVRERPSPPRAEGAISSPSVLQP